MPLATISVGVDRTTSDVAERWSSVARWIAISIGILVLLALPIVFAAAIPRSGELGGLNIVPVIGFLVLELCIWWKPVELSVKAPAPAAAMLFCFGAIVSQLLAVVLSATDLVVDSYLDILLVVAIKVGAAVGTWTLQAPHRP